MSDCEFVMSMTVAGPAVKLELYRILNEVLACLPNRRALYSVLQCAYLRSCPTCIDVNDWALWR